VTERSVNANKGRPAKSLADVRTNNACPLVMS
jgi:hypothetical protein